VYNRVSVTKEEMWKLSGMGFRVFA
jgi:hypothetical protein